MSVRVRFAPSPTGSLHVGGARTALFNFLFARKYQGQFIIRVEDTDLERNKESYLKEQLEVLLWLGLNWDEGPSYENLQEFKGDFGPYRQSKRLDIYKKYAQDLLNQGRAYYCFLTDEQITEMKSKAVKDGNPHRVISPYRDWSLEKSKERVEKGESAVIRFKTPDSKKEYKIKDKVRGNVTFPSDMVGDFVIVRSNNFPVYNFCCAIDDALMKITHVLRAEEHLPNTLRQCMIFKAFNFPLPEYMHLSLILDKDRKKLSKRSGALSCLEYRERGYLPQSLLNFLALLGWNPKSENEFFNLEELIKSFSEKNFNSSGAVFDEAKLTWLNSHHLRNLPHTKFWEMLEDSKNVKDLNLPQDEEWKKSSFELLKASFANLNEAFEIFKLLCRDIFSIDKNSTLINEWPKTKEVLTEWKEVLLTIDKKYLSQDDFKNIKTQIQKKVDVKGRFLFMPLRVAMIGQLKGLELTAIVTLIDQKTLLKRVKQVLNS